jgi:aryl-alcohol dehydrogenase-like predicted oxidoreductase
MIPHITLGKTGLSVSRLGIGSSYGVGTRDILWAVEQGVNYLYWGSMRRGRFGKAIREAVAAHGRDRVVVVIQSYARVPSMLGVSLRWALRRLGLDHADLLLFGWWNHEPRAGYLEAASRLRESGLIRSVMISGHDRPALARMAQSGSFDAVMCRYNAAHRGAEKEIFPQLGEERPGVVAYTATRWGTLLKPVRKMPAGLRVPPAGSCYRFCLSHPSVDLVLCGPANGEELREAVRGVEAGPLPADEMAEIRAFGDLVHASYGQSMLPRFPWNQGAVG